MTVKPSDIATLVELFATSGWDELHVEIEGLQLFLSTDPNARLVHGSVDAGPAPIVPAKTQEAAAPRSTAPASKELASAPKADEVPDHWIAVKAPNLGTFYRAPKPGAAPYVEVGKKVAVETEICMLEVMKLFTTVRAGTTGIVRRICVDDGQMVEHDETLFYIEKV